MRRRLVFALLFGCAGLIAGAARLWGDAPTAVPPTRTARSASDPVRACPPGEPLGGFIEMEQSFSTYSYTCRGQAKLWFDLTAGPQVPWPQVLGQWHHAKRIRYELSSRGCVDVADPGREVCTAPRGHASGVHEFSIGPYGVEDFPSSIGFLPTGPELSFATLPDAISKALSVPLTCVTEGGPSTGPWTYVVHGVVKPFDAGGCDARRNFPCTAPTACRQAARDACTLRPQLYAVIPFTGDQSWALAWPDGNSETHVFFWDVCCGCGTPGRDRRRGSSPTPTPTPGDDECPPPTQLLARLDTARTEYGALMTEQFALQEQIQDVRRRIEDNPWSPSDSVQNARRERLQEELRELEAKLAAVLVRKTNKGNEIDNLGALYRLACIAYEECRGGNPASCEWPVPQ